MGKLRCSKCDFHCNKWQYMKNHNEQIHNKINIGIMTGFQIKNSCRYFLTGKILEENKLRLSFYHNYNTFNTLNHNYFEILNYHIFDHLDILIIENNNLTNQASSRRIIEYAKEKNPNIKIIKICQINFPIFPINWTDNNEYNRDYKNWRGVKNIDFNRKFKLCCRKLYRTIAHTNYDESIVDYIKNNFHKKKLFATCSYPTNILLYKMWESIFSMLKLDFNKYNFDKSYCTPILVPNKQNLYPLKLISDLNLEYTEILKKESLIDENNSYYDKIYKKNKRYINRPIISNVQSELL